MKLRNGFVSNSSSSSFIVIRYDLFNSVTLITYEQEKKLMDFGFVKTQVCCPVQFYFEDSRFFENDEPCIVAGVKIRNTEIKSATTNAYNLGYEVICNQDEVIFFLLKNKIPFKASLHYDEYTMVYKGKQTVKVLCNFGHMYGWLENELNINKTLQKYKKIRTINRKDLISGKKHYY
jgi:hypothetical protein